MAQLFSDKTPPPRLWRAHTMARLLHLTNRAIRLTTLLTSPKTTKLPTQNLRRTLSKFQRAIKPIPLSRLPPRAKPTNPVQARCVKARGPHRRHNNHNASRQGPTGGPRARGGLTGEKGGKSQSAVRHRSFSLELVLLAWVPSLMRQVWDCRGRRFCVW